MEITKELQKLAKFSDSAFPVFSVYLNTQLYESSQHDRSVDFLSEHLHQASALPLASDAARMSLEQDLRQIKHWGEKHLDGRSDVSAAGFALFTCSAAGLWVEFPSPLPFDNQFTIADRPALWQLVCLDTQYTNTLVVLMDAQAARVCEVVLGGLRAETGFAGTTDTPQGRALPPSASASHYREVVEYLAAHLATRPQTYVIVSGPDDVLSQFHDLLPPPVQPQIIDQVTLNMRDTTERILQVARETLEQHEREADWLDVQQLFTMAGRGDGAVLGLSDTLIAVNAGVIQKLIMQQDFQHYGWRCLECDNIDVGIAQQCGVCAGKVMAVELREALVSEVLRSNGFVEPIELDDRLALYDGVGALLREP
jgi:hypothetical protein